MDERETAMNLRSKISGKKLVAGASLLIIVAFAAQKISIGQLAAEAQERYTDLQIFSKVLNLVQQYYVEEVDTKKLVYGAIKGMLRELDPHTNFLPPEIYRDFENETNGEFMGLGVEISVQNGVLTVISPIEDTPAFIAGVKPGDKIIAIDGKSTKGLSLVEASQLMRGKRGSKTTLSVIRDGSDDPKNIAITRGSVRIRSVKSQDLSDGYLYTRITSFIENTGKDLEKILTDYEKKNKSIRGLVIDLRRNPGGLLDQAIRVTDLFVKEGTIVSTIGRDKDKKEVNVASKRAKFTEFPIIVLINGYSASASEIVAGALQDNKRAIIMGERSFGKGSVQSVVKLGDGSGLKLTVARYYTPSGRSIQAEGIHPDIEVLEVADENIVKPDVKAKAMREKDMQGHLEGDAELREKNNTASNAGSWWKDATGKNDKVVDPRDKLLSEDYQVFQAYNYLKAWKLMRGIGNK